jgi:ABC-2 type transport system ATP-binding protein
MSIRVDQVDFHYPGAPKKALEGISFDLPDAQFCALLGPNGAGKTTLFSLLTRLYSLQCGEISIQGDDLKQAPASVMQRLGVVFQQSTLDLDLTVAQNLYYHAALHGYSRREAQPAIERELERMSLTERAKDKVRALNGGHRRRVEIARALLHTPDVLLLDEPSTGLDPHSRASLNEHVRSLCESDNLTVLWATHLIEEIQPQDRVLLLNQGKLLSKGTGEDLLSLSQQTTLADAFKALTRTRPPEAA